MWIKVRVTTGDDTLGPSRTRGVKIDVSECEVMDYQGSMEDLFREKMAECTEMLISMDEDASDVKNK